MAQSYLKFTRNHRDKCSHPVLRSYANDNHRLRIATSITHMPFGPVKSLTWANGITGTWVYDLDYRASGIRANDGGTNIYYSSYGYNGNDSITSILDNVTPANNQTLQYNSADWLNFASGSYGTGINLTYDSTGNRLTYGATSYTIGSTSNRLATTSGNAVSYISSGNISAIASGPSFTYNKANQTATAVVSGVTSTYGYDAFGQRLRAQVGTNPVKITTYGLDNELLTETNTGVKTDYIYLDGIPVAAVQPAASTVSYIHTDYLGTPQKATNAAKATVWSGAYDPNGKITPTTSITMNLRFPGQFLDDSGFYHNGFRNYMPNSAQGGGRYREADPIGLEGGVNPYVYANNNTFKFIDPLGLDEIEREPLAPAIIAPPRLIPGTNIPDRGVYEGQADKYTKSRREYDAEHNTVPLLPYPIPNSKIDPYGEIIIEPPYYPASTPRESWAMRYSPYGAYQKKKFDNYCYPVWSVD